MPTSKYATDFLSFVNASPTPFHVVESAKQRLLKAGFKEIRERESWSTNLRPGGKYYLTRNESSIIAFAIGEKWKPGNAIAMLGAHTDSPALRIKPVSKKKADGFLQVGVETYGGGLWHTWFDRDLSIAGRAMVKSKDGKITSKLLKVDRPILRIPTLAIHLDRQETFTFNKETQLLPIAGLVAAELNKQAPKSDDKDEKKKEESKEFRPLQVITERHHPVVVDIIAEAAGTEVDQIMDFEILLYDTQDACIGGVNNDFIFSARLDNQMMSYCSVEGLIASLEGDGALRSDSTIRLISLFDHEEIGSRTTQGADSNLLPAIIRRLSVVQASEGSDSSESFKDLTLDTFATLYEESLSKSFLISADMAHSVHPNYPAKYDSEHRPEMNKGTVVKINANARYATNTPGIILLEEVARIAKPATTVAAASAAATKDKASSVGVPLQLFVVRNDSSCGSTIGPMLSAKMGVRTLDLGNPQLSMHSIRECGGVDDVEYAIRLFESYFENYEEVSSRIVVD